MKRIFKTIIMVAMLSCQSEREPMGPPVNILFSSLGSVVIEGKKIDLFTHYDKLRLEFPDAILKNIGRTGYFDRREYGRLSIENIWGLNASAGVQLVDEEAYRFGIRFSGGHRFPNLRIGLFDTELFIKDTDTVPSIVQRITQLIPLYKERKFSFSGYSNHQEHYTFRLGSEEIYEEDEGYIVDVIISIFRNEKNVGFSFSHVIDHRYEQPLYRLMQKQGVTKPSEVYFDMELTPEEQERMERLRNQPLY